MNKKILVIGMVMLLGMLAVSVMPFNVIAQKDDNNIINNDNVKDNKINAFGDLTETDVGSNVYPIKNAITTDENNVYFIGLDFINATLHICVADKDNLNGYNYYDTLITIADIGCMINDNTTIYFTIPARDSFYFWYKANHTLLTFYMGSNAQPNGLGLYLNELWITCNGYIPKQFTVINVNTFIYNNCTIGGYQGSDIYIDYDYVWTGASGSNRIIKVGRVSHTITTKVIGGSGVSVHGITGDANIVYFTETKGYNTWFRIGKINKSTNVYTAINVTAGYTHTAILNDGDLLYYLGGDMNGSLPVRINCMYKSNSTVLYYDTTYTSGIDIPNFMSFEDDNLNPQTNRSGIYFPEPTIGKIGFFEAMPDTNNSNSPSLNNDFSFNFINTNITSGLEEFRPYCNGTGTNLIDALIYIDFWLYYVSNNSEIHFLNDTADTTEDTYDCDNYLFVPDVFDSEVCRFKAKAVITEELILNNGNDRQINLVSQIAISEPFTITNTTPYLNPDVVITNPTTLDNYTTRELIEVMGGGTGDYIDGVNITIDYYCYFVSNSTTIHFDNYTKINDYETGWYVDELMTFGFNETNVIRLIIRCMITPEMLCKDDNASDVVWGISEAVTITKMAVRIYTPNGYENYTAESTQEIIFNVTYIQEFFTVNIEVSLSINGIDGDYTIINETEVMMGEENLYYNETVTWETPDNLSYDCFIKVNVSATIPTYLTDMLIDYAEDKSDDNFTIYKPSTIPPIIPPSSTITITYIQIGNWQLGNITEATAYAGEDIPILIKAVSKINLYSIDIIYHINNGTEKLIGMELQNGTTKNGYWLGYIPAREEGTIVTFHIYALNVQGDSKTTEDIEITIITEPITEELEWDTICIWLILILAVIIVIAAIFRRK